MGVLEVTTLERLSLAGKLGTAAVRDDRTKTSVLRDDDARRATLILKDHVGGLTGFQAFRSRRTCTTIRFPPAPGRTLGTRHIAGGALSFTAGDASRVILRARRVPLQACGAASRAARRHCWTAFVGCVATSAIRG